MLTVAHISDLHLQSGVPARQAQVEPILEEINRRKPDLVVISGDVTDDGWDSIEELKWAREWLEERINGDWFAVPGNHDVGNFVDQQLGPVTSERVKKWGQVFGYSPNRVFPPSDPGKGIEWIIAGINSMVIGSGSDIEKRELSRLYEYFDQCGNRCIEVALFLHSPLFIEEPFEESSTNTGYWLGPASGRKKVLKSIDRDCISLIGSGHVHQTQFALIDGIDVNSIKIIWAPPASGTWVHAPGLPNPPMPEKTGFFLHTLHNDGRVESELVQCAPMLKLYEHDPNQ